MTATFRMPAKSCSTYCILAAKLKSTCVEMSALKVKKPSKTSCIFKCLEAEHTNAFQKPEHYKVLTTRLRILSSSILWEFMFTFESTSEKHVLGVFLW